MDAVLSSPLPNLVLATTSRIPEQSGNAPVDSYLWSTGETTRIISVEPSDTTWYWVTTTAAGSSDESATLMVDPNLPAEIFADGFEDGTTVSWSKTIP